MAHTVTVIKGDGIGPEVVEATQKIINATGVSINWEEVEAGAAVFKKGLATGVPQETVDSIAKNKVALKGPLETPIGFGEKSANVTLRKLFETYGNIRPVQELPGVKTPYSGRNIDLVIVRENVEDLYAGIEHMQTPNVAQCLKVISRYGCEKIIRLAFEFARSEGRKKIHCATKANIMKLTEGLVKKVFEEISQEYKDIEANHIIVDNCAHMLVKAPEQFDVIVTTNMNGDILSDLSSALVGGLGFAPGANIGDGMAIFEAVHGSAPKYAGKNVINPTAVLLSGVMMLRYLGEFEAANHIEQALFITLDHDKKLTRDVYGVTNPISTTGFTDAIISNLGKTYPGYKNRPYKPIKMSSAAIHYPEPKTRLLHGFDVFIERHQDVKEIGEKVDKLCENKSIKLKMISCRGVKVYPGIKSNAKLIDQVRCRLTVRDDNDSLSDDQILQTLKELTEIVPWTHIEKLHIFDGVKAFTKAHGEE